VSVAGAAIGVLIDWDCNFDRDYELCSPSFNFVRVSAACHFCMQMDDEYFIAGRYRVTNWIWI
jgi:hypothetical protein